MGRTLAGRGEIVEGQGLPPPTGSIILCLLALVVGFQLSLQAIVLDIQATPR